MPLDFETLPTIEAIIDTLIELLILPTDTWTELQLQDLQTIHQSALRLKSDWWDLKEARTVPDAYMAMTYSRSSFHDLRTWVNSMIGFSRVILKGIDGPVPAEHRQAIEQVYEDSCAVLQTINAIWERRTPPD